MFKEHEVVTLKNTVPGVPLPTGSEGTIVIVHPVNPPVYLVEFSQVSDDNDGLYDIEEADLIPVAKK